MKSASQEKRRRKSPAGVRKEQQIRQHLATEAARIIVRERSTSYQVAKQKAAGRLGIPSTRSLPSNEEVEQAIIAYQRLFYGDQQRLRLRALRQTALNAMLFFEQFKPRLVGSVLNGTATEHAEVCLHLFAETAEEVDWFLMNHSIPHKVVNKRFFIHSDTQQTYPAYRFIADDTPIEATVFPSKGLRQAPRTTVDGQTIERASTQVVKALLENDELP